MSGGFLHRLATETTISRLELTWGFCTINVVMMTVGLFLLLKNQLAELDKRKGRSQR